MNYFLCWKELEDAKVEVALQYNDEYDKFYKKRLLVETGEGTVPCNKILVRKPPKRLVDEYEKTKSKVYWGLIWDYCTKNRTVWAKSNLINSLEVARHNFKKKF